MRHPKERIGEENRRIGEGIGEGIGESGTLLILFQKSRVRRWCCHHPLPSEPYGPVSRHTPRAFTNASRETRFSQESGDILNCFKTIKRIGESGHSWGIGDTFNYFSSNLAGSRQGLLRGAPADPGESGHS